MPASKAPNWLRRLFGATSRESNAKGPRVTGADPIEIQRGYWSMTRDERDDEIAALRAFGLDALSWRELFRLHHLFCLARLPSSGAAGLLDGEALADPDPMHPHLLDMLTSAASPFRARHGFAWQGDRAPEGEQVPYSDFQGRLSNAALTHLGALEVLTLDSVDDPTHGRVLVPRAVDFVAFDEIMTISSPRPDRDPAQLPPGFRMAQVLGEYGNAPRVVLLPASYGITWTLADAERQSQTRARWFGHVGASLRLPAPYEAKADARGAPLFGVGLQDWACQSDFVDEGLRHFVLADMYQVSLAIDQDDPRFVDKCRGRGLDPDDTRASVAAENQRRKPKLRLKTL